MDLTPASPRVVRRATRPTLAGESAAELRRWILVGDIPLGAQITEESTAKLLGVARSTVREVLTQLEHEGLLTRDPATRILHVTRLTPDEVRDIYVARRFFELAAIDAFANATEEQIVEMRAAADAVPLVLAGGDPDESVRSDWRCHIALVAVLNSVNLSTAHGLLLSKLHLAIAALEEPGEDEVSARAHAIIADALIAGDNETARTVLLQHMKDGEEELIEALSEVP